MTSPTTPASRIAAHKAHQATLVASASPATVTLYPNPYTTPLDVDNLDEMRLIARGQMPGQPNHAAYRQAQVRKAALDARPRTTSHKRLMRAVTRAVSAAYPNAKIEVRNVGRGPIAGFNDKRTGKWVPLRFGQVGEADLRVTEQGRAIALECKALETGDRQRDTQIKWQGRWERAGGYYAVVHTVGEALEAMKEACLSV